MPSKDAQLQIRITASQKAELRRRAKAAGADVSAYVLSCALPDGSRRLDAALAALRMVADPDEQRFAFAELADVLIAFDTDTLARTVEYVDVARLAPFAQNYVAAMIEDACTARRLAPPAWTRAVAPLEEPWFAAPLRSLRLHLLRASPLAYKRRNLFVDSGTSARV